MRQLSVLIALLCFGCAATTSHETSVRRLGLESDNLVVNFTLIQPPSFYRGIWNDVSDCIGFDSPPPFEAIWWAVADTISTPDGYLAYGMTVFENARPVGIILERPYRAFASTISHEVVHAQTGQRSHEGIIWNCVLPSPVSLPLRRVPDANSTSLGADRREI